MIDWPHAKDIAADVVREWILAPGKPTMATLRELIEVELVKAFNNGNRAGVGVALEAAATVAEDEFPSPCAAKIRAIKEFP